MIKDNNYKDQIIKLEKEISRDKPNIMLIERN